MHSLRLTDDAKRDLAEIRKYTRRKFGETQARIYMSRLRDGFKVLRRHAEIGYSINDLKEGYRCFQIEHHRVFYRIASNYIGIVAILHESQLPKRHLSQRYLG